MKNITSPLFLALWACMSTPHAHAADTPPPTKETVVFERVAIPSTNWEMGMGLAEFPPNAAKPRHHATGPEVCFVLEGEVRVEVEGQPTRVVRAGETFQLPAGAVHVTSAGPAGAKVLATWAHVPGQPFNIETPR